MNLTIETETAAFRDWTETLIGAMDREGSGRALRALAFEFLSLVIPKTPVDTGRARGGWASYLIARGRHFAVGGSDPTAEAEGIEAGSFEEDLRGAEQFIVLVNAVRYITILEFGGSRQAPAGMMRITFREMRAKGSQAKAVAAAFVRAVAQTNRTARMRTRRTLPG